MAVPALPRSLDPLPEESLTGYVLRLSHRLGLSPGWLMRRTGIAGLDVHGLLSSDVSLATTMPEDLAADFATATRLTPGEVAALTLTCWNGRYPPVTRVSQPFTARRRPVDGWLFRRAARYCPQCLAGDGSLLQKRHGGPWKKFWRLPVVFACPDHRIYLQYLCPGCVQPVNSGEQGRLVARVGDAGLHPAQCRNSLRPHDRPRRSDPACGTRLDQPTPSPRQLSPQMLALQQRILTMLDPAQRADAAALYFNDLRMLTSLACVTWPAVRPTGSGVPTEAADQHLERQATVASNRRYHYLTALPAETDATAVLLHAAHVLLDSADLRTALAPLIARDRSESGSTSWSTAFANKGDSCSERLREAAGPLIRTHRGSRTRFGPRPAPGRQSFLAEHIPAFLRQEWADQHFSQFSGLDARIIRRTAAIRLTQLALGGSLKQAAQFLGFGNDQRSAASVHRWAAAQTDPFAFDEALNDLANKLDDDPAPTNYRQRRDVLRNWALDQQIWHEMVAALPLIPGNQPSYDDRKRQAASVFVWTHVTGGEHLFAPRPLEAVQEPGVRMIWANRRNTTWHLLTHPEPLKHYAVLRAALTAYADDLARAIDRRDGRFPAGPPDSLRH
ncbi:TniQ family protein [Streptomyces sp. NPDC059479]|uniref:TniQ family protein n=1 Tax=Streptomyces sp. NPDC059479 TaxID=3346848 RepID=UPI0036A0597E